VRVRRTVTIGISQANGIYTFSGTIRRAEAGLQVTVARLDAVTKRVTGVASAVTNAAGTYTIRTRLPIGQAGYYTLTAPTASLDAGRSRLYGLIVPRPAPAPVARPVAAAPRRSLRLSLLARSRPLRRRSPTATPSEPPAAHQSVVGSRLQQPARP
jgi:hypothetical protein